MIECDGAAVAEAVRALAGTFGQAQAQEVVVHAPLQLAAPAAETPGKNRRAPRVAKPEAEDEKPGISPSRLAKLALREGPKSNAQIAQWISQHGMPGYSAGRAGVRMVFMAKSGQVKRGGTIRHAIWSLA